MSTILKALRRLEQDKAREQSQSLEENVAAPEAHTRGRGSGWFLGFLALCILFGVAGGALLTRLWSSRDDGDRTAPVATAPRVVAAPAPSEPELRRRPVELPTSPPAALSPESPEHGSRPSAQPSSPGREAVPRGDPPVAVLRRAAPGEEEGGAELPRGEASAQPAAASIARRLQRPEVEKAVLADRDQRGTAPIVVRAPVPDLSVSRTIWHPDSDRRAAVISVRGQPEPLRLREGDSVGGLTVLEITPSGVNFDHDGVQLYKRVGG